MIDIEQIKNYFPASIRNNAVLKKYMLKEYIQLLILNYLSKTVYIKKIAFIGGTNLRLIKNINRFSEDLDFDCKDFSYNDFLKMTDGILLFLHRYGFNAEIKDRDNEKLKAFRRSIYFPKFLFDLKLSAFKEDQKFLYNCEIKNIKYFGFFFPFPTPPDDILCAMKIAALLSRKKGRDFYDVMFLLGQTTPDYDYLNQKCGISNLRELKSGLLQVANTTNLKLKLRDFTHLVFDKDDADKILNFRTFVETL